MNRALIIGASPTDGSERLLVELAEDAELIVAADAAAEWSVNCGVVPHVAVGDFDSALPDAESRLQELGVEVCRYPVAKDETDLDLALAEARSRGAESVTLTACSGGRLDHALAALGTLLRAAELRPVLREPTMDVYPVCSDVTHEALLPTRPGQTISVIALSPCAGVSLQGMEYALSDADLTPLSSRGVSNSASGECVRITLDTGTLLVIALHEIGGA